MKSVIAGACHVAGCRHLGVVRRGQGHGAKGDRLLRPKHWCNAGGKLALQYRIHCQCFLRQFILTRLGFSTHLITQMSSCGLEDHTQLACMQR